MTIADLHRTFTLDSVSDGALVPVLSAMAAAGDLDGKRGFEEAMVHVIETCGDSPADGWHAFYVNSLAELRAGTVDFARIHRQALSLLSGSSVLEVGSCFGLFALQCVQDGHVVDACDICPGAVERLADESLRLGLPLTPRIGDARALPYPDRSVDTVTLIHLLEHLEPGDVATAITEAVRVARRRVVIAVPFEDEPSEHFGHLVSLSEEDLLTWAAPWVRCGMRATVFTDCGGWLVLDVAPCFESGQIKPRLLAT
ncbi:mycofactocin oligosaccharide methyltransferase MftM [Gordonia malaquae]|uniref:mycofactocin oligosaccharide methyltransferase MftM n=1 Tax=Gordonia malaquae TaxID=410332 RepID=UPI0030C79E4E